MDIVIGNERITLDKVQQSLLRRICGTEQHKELQRRDNIRSVSAKEQHMSNALVLERIANAVIGLEKS